ncbi:DUF7144 family membrane protein [Streptacidiphilus jiangxiensis]|uniref:DUF7144 domain-containing protein n=1 Tax=Streptacidiphilus jiangxiensis TaxID=235985 RepID=A0A1H7XL02_STRJI|nr:hypothetical protein [Streptacidiphilus jiangxiensis]SEM34431.1 hypothetical protein SAMN05414137_12486 [Streptacidiphilus jiangxiensis]
MATTSSNAGSAPSRRGGGWAAGATVFAGVLLLINGTLGILQGASAVSKDKIYIATARYVYQFDLTGWGWVQIALGAVAVVVGVGLLADQTWARWAGIVIAALSLVGQFLWLPYYPFWAIVVMAIDVFIIWGLTRPSMVRDH